MPDGQGQARFIVPLFSHAATNEGSLPSRSNVPFFCPFFFLSHTVLQVPGARCKNPMPMSLEPLSSHHHVHPKRSDRDPSFYPPSPSALARDTPCTPCSSSSFCLVSLLPFLPLFSLPPPDYLPALHRHSSTCYCRSIRSSLPPFPLFPSLLPRFFLCPNHSRSLNHLFFFAASSDHPVQSFRAYPFPFFRLSRIVSSSSFASSSSSLPRLDQN